MSEVDIDSVNGRLEALFQNTLVYMFQEMREIMMDTKPHEAILSVLTSLDGFIKSLIISTCNQITLDLDYKNQLAKISMESVGENLAKFVAKTENVYDKSTEISIHCGN